LASIGKKRYTEVSDIVLSSLKVFKTFKQEFKDYKKTKKLSFENIDRLERDLYDLKNSTHSLFRANVSEKKEIEETDIFDLIVSSIFHEMLHLKEYIYIIEKYEPRYLVLEKKIGDKKELDPSKRDFLRHSRETVGEAKLGMPLKLQGINELVDDALPHLARIIKMNSFDNRLVRALFVYSDYLDNLFPEGGIKKLYSEVYAGGWIEGYFLVAESFRKSGFGLEATTILKKIIEEGAVLKQEKIVAEYIERARGELGNISAGLA